jgi:hypothetical protein
LNTKTLLLGSESIEPNIRGGLLRESKQQLQTTKEIVVRDLHLPIPQHFCLLFERLPVWLFSIDREIAHRVTILGHDSPTSLLAWCTDHDVDTTLINIVAARLGMGRLSFIVSQHNVPNNIKLLVSGTLPYLVTQSAIHRNGLLMLDEHFRSKTIPTTPTVIWRRLRHRTFGGPTSFSALVGFRSSPYRSWMLASGL